MLVVDDTVTRTVNYPTQDQIAGASAVYLGGHIYDGLSSSVARALLLEGYEIELVKTHGSDYASVVQSTPNLGLYASLDPISYGTISGNVETQQPPLVDDGGYSMKFNGNGHLLIPNTSAIRPHATTNEFSIELWVSHEVTADGLMMLYRHSDFGVGVSVQVFDGGSSVYSCYFYDSTGKLTQVQGASVAATSEPLHLVAKWDGNFLSLAQDGIIYGGDADNTYKEEGFNNVPFFGTEGGVLGRNGTGGGNYFTGHIDNFAFYQRALTETEIIDHASTLRTAA